MKKKVKKTSSSGDLSQGDGDEPLHGKCWYCGIIYPPSFQSATLEDLFINQVTYVLLPMIPEMNRQGVYAWFFFHWPWFEWFSMVTILLP